MRAMIFAAGLGTRLKPLTDTLPKALLPLGGKTLLEWQIDRLKEAGLTDIIINIHHFPDAIIDYVHQHQDFGCHICFSDERDQLLETGGGLRKAIGTNTDEPILAMNVDILSNIHIGDLLAQYAKDGLSRVVVSERKTSRYFCFDSEGRMTGWTNISTGEKIGKDGRHLAFSGMQVLNANVLRRLQEIKEEKFSVTPFYTHICDTETLLAYIPDRYRMMDVGKIDQLADAEHFAQSL